MVLQVNDGYGLSLDTGKQSSVAGVTDRPSLTIQCVEWFKPRVLNPVQVTVYIILHGHEYVFSHVYSALFLGGCRIRNSSNDIYSQLDDST